MMEWTFDADDGANPELSGICKRYVERFDEMFADGKGLLFYGTVGTGKTFMASCIANALIDKGYSCLVTNFARITNELQSDFNKRQAYFDHLNQYSLIVLDDFASERDTEYMGEIVMNVIDARYRVKKPIIIATNLSGEEFDNPSDVRRQRVFSRLFEMCLPYEVKGKDRRKRTLLEDTQKYGWLFGKE
jgi:DNA replication protein DnaC